MEGEENNEIEDESHRRMTKYKLPTTNNTKSTLVLELQSLPENDGILSQVGADAWYSSAILASMMLYQQQPQQQPPPTEEEEDNDDDDPSLVSSVLTKLLLLDCDDNNNTIINSTLNILELGSGAVGLSGLACYVALQQRQQEIVMGDATTTSINRRRKTTKSFHITMHPQNRIKAMMKTQVCITYRLHPKEKHKAKQLVNIMRGYFVRVIVKI